MTRSTIAAAALLGVSLGPTAPAGGWTPSSARHAQSLVARQIVRIAGGRRQVSCVQARSSSRRRGESHWLCAWEAVRRRDNARCAGTYRVSLVNQRWRLTSNGYNCVARPRHQAVGFGFNDNSVAQGLVSATADAALSREIGANVVRVTLHWESVEARPGRYQFGFYDRLYVAMRAQGIRPLFIMLYAPRWAWPQSALCLDLISYCHFPPGAAHYADAGRMAAAIAARYPQAAGIEIWNEPNLSVFWQPRPDPIAYATLLRTCYLAVKRVDASMPVVMGGLSNEQPPGGSRDVSLHDFLQALYAQGTRNATDAIAFHPYPSQTDPTLLERDFATVRALRNQFGDVTKPLWVTELGITTSDPLLPVSELNQAAQLVATYRSLMAMGDVRMIIFHTLIESGPSTSPEFGYGVLRPDLSAKAGFCALGRLRNALFTCNG